MFKWIGIGICLQIGMHIWHFMMGVLYNSLKGKVQRDYDKGAFDKYPKFVWLIERNGIVKPKKENREPVMNKIGF